MVADGRDPAGLEAPWLAIETSTQVGSVAVGRGGRLLAEVVLGTEVRHAESLLPAAAFALERARLRQDELAKVIVGAGPGSFTGVRIAAATAKGLVHALGVPLAAYSSLAALAAGSASGDRPVCALFDARRNEVYAACYVFPAAGGMLTELEPAALPIEEALGRLRGRGPLFVGDGALRFAGQIEAAGGQVGPALSAYPRAAALLWLGERVPAAGRIEAPAGWEPDYLRPSGAERLHR